MALIKGFKVTDSERRIRVGIAVKTLLELTQKTKEKFKLKSDLEIRFQAPDGTIIESEDYFETLQPQTLLIWVKAGERAQTDAEILYRTIREVNEEYLTAGEKVQEFFTEKMKNKVFKLAELLKEVETDKTNESERKLHPEWFQGLDTTAKTKEEYMFRRAQDRVRTYFYRTKDELIKNPMSQSEKLGFLLKDLQEKLKQVKFFGCYFDRSATKSICDEKGNFFCEGRWDKPCCLYIPVHSINPYKSPEERIIFQTWNLDHAIERTRSIIPSIKDALVHDDKLNGKKKKIIDVERIFDDLFTRNNLKFVHIVCHDKGAHDTKAGPYLI
ncbi:DNA fragmentation factor subunit beta [Onthophagus taurus]|uniref:DNA fragmentation factor subunit beta n=1 Tax=Onthophagus taurus TaxID=166361 RepID=UPI000C20EC05|nr:DNA fragmentation factor subunit beta [Onthophagus taurus]